MTLLPINDLGRHTKAVRAELTEALVRVMARSWYVLGEEGANFEREFAAYCDVRHCIGVGNGTDALELSFRALGIGAGTRVATVANAGYYTTTALNAVGAAPVYVDVDPASQLMDLAPLQGLLDGKAVDAVVVTHLFGLMHDMDALSKMTKAAGVQLVEDCAQAHGARRSGYMAGSRSDIACFSFYPTKNLGGLGDGGALVTDSSSLATRLKSLRQYGWEVKYEVRTPGGRNSRLDELQAAVLRAMLPHLESWNSRRRDIARQYSEGIRHSNVTCPPLRGEEYVAHLYVVGCTNPSDLRKHLTASGIASDVHYPTPDHLQPCARERHTAPSLPVTEYLAQHVLTLPCFPEMTDREVARIVDCVNAW